MAGSRDGNGNGRRELGQLQGTVAALSEMLASFRSETQGSFRDVNLAMAAMSARFDAAVVAAAGRFDGDQQRQDEHCRQCVARFEAQITDMVTWRAGLEGASRLARGLAQALWALGGGLAALLGNSLLNHVVLRPGP